MKLVAIPMIAKTQIQKIAPGPPTRIARIGPEMFPTPIRLPILMQKTWNDDTVCAFFPGDTVTCYEQRMCQLEDGTLVVISWNEDMKTGQQVTVTPEEAAQHILSGLAAHNGPIILEK